jgi:hypothetical protein
LKAVPVTAKLFFMITFTACVIWPLTAPAGVNRCAGAHAAVGGEVHDRHDEHTSVTGVPM